MSDQESIVLHQMGNHKVIEGGTFDQPIKLSGQEINIEPTPMLYQAPFYLSEADFEKIRRPSGKLAGFGWSCIGLSAISSLRMFIKLSETGFSQSSVISSKYEVITTVAILAIGSLFLALSSYFSHTQNAIFREIKKHFDSNKPKLEIRYTGKTK